MTTIPLFVDFCVGNNKLHEVSQIYIQPDWWKKRLIMTQVIPIDPSDVLRKIKTTQWGEFQSCSTCSAKWNAFEDSPRVECLFKSGLVQIPVSSQQRSIVRAKVFPLLLFRPTHPPFAHPPVVDDSHKVVGQKCELSGFCKFSYCLHLSGFSLWRKTGKNWCDVQKSAQTFRHIHEARTAISSLIFFLNEKDKKSFRPPPPSRWAGQSWVCLQHCMPSTFALQCIAPEGNQVASPGVRPPALPAIISSWRVNVSDANTLSHRACQKNKHHKGGDTHSKHEWQIPCRHAHKYRKSMASVFWQVLTCRPDRPNQGSSQ